MEPHGQSPWYLHEIPSYAKASEGYPPAVKSAEALMGQLVNDRPNQKKQRHQQRQGEDGSTPAFAKSQYATKAPSTAKTAWEILRTFIVPHVNPKPTLRSA